MASCRYCDRNSVRYETYPEVVVEKVVAKERVPPPLGVRDRGVTREVKQRALVVKSRSFQICKKCRAVWSGPASRYEYVLECWQNPSINPSEYEAYRREWYGAVRRYGLNLSPLIQK